MHWDVKCDGCEKINLVYYRYKCLRCANYDLCDVCYENKVETGRHSNSHPFQCLLDRAARELFFSGEEIPDLCADSFTCPFCGKMGHTVKELVKHVQAKHRGDTTPVICPLCVAVPSASTVRLNNLVSHVSLMHGMGILRFGGGAGSGSSQLRNAGFELPALARGHGRGHVTAHVTGTPSASASPSASAGASASAGPGAGAAAAAAVVHGHRNRSPPPEAARATFGGFQWPPRGHSLGSSASQEEEFYSESWLPEQSSLSGSMHTMRDADLDLGNMAGAEHGSPQLRRATPLVLLQQEYPAQRQAPSRAEPPHGIEEDFSDIETDDVAAHEPTSSI